MEFSLIFVAAVIIACVLFDKIADRVGIPALLAFMLLGMLFGVDGIFRIDFQNFAFAETGASIALIFIMFYGGFGTNWKVGKPAAGKAVLLSTLGVVMTALLSGVLMHFFLGFDLKESILIGGILGSTDAASVFAILRSKRLNLKYNTASLLEIESGSNDPAAYMLTMIMIGILTGKSSEPIYLLLIKQIVFGVGCGVIIAYSSHWFLNNFDFASSGFDTVAVIAIALLSYALPSFIGGNGYLSTYLVGIYLGNSHIPGKKELVNFFDGITGLMQMFLFFLLGLLATPSQILAVLIPAIGITFLMSFLVRPLVVFALLTPFKAKRNQMLLVSFSGLRGAASIVFAIMASLELGSTDIDIFHLVLTVVLFSILIQGTALPWVSGKLNMISSSDDVLRTFTDYSEKTPIQFIQFTVPENHSWIGRSLKELRFPPATLLVLMQRNQESIIPKGDTTICAGDRIILAAKTAEHVEGVRLSEKHVDKRWDGKTILECSKKQSGLVIMIERGDDIIIPDGQTILQEGDILVINKDKSA